MPKYKPNKDGWYITYVWDGTYDQTNKKHRKQIRSNKSSKDLENKVAEFKRKVELHENSISTNITLHEYAKDWLKTEKANIRPNTRAKYENVIAKFPKAGTVRMSDFSRRHLLLIMADETDHIQGLILMYLKQIVKSAIRNHIMSINAFDDIFENVVPPKPAKTLKRPLSPAEKEAIFKIDLKDRQKAFLYFIYYCGLRREEVIALRSSDYKNGQLTINKVITFPKSNKPTLENKTKSDNSVRIVPVPTVCQEFFDSYCQDKDFLFTTATGELITLQSYRRLIEGIVKKIDKEVGYKTKLTAHIFRHNYCTELCYQVPLISIPTIAKLMGDTVKVVMDVYNHVMSEKEDIPAALENIFNPKPPENETKTVSKQNQNSQKLQEC